MRINAICVAAQVVVAAISAAAYGQVPANKPARHRAALAQAGAHAGAFRIGVLNLMTGDVATATQPNVLIDQPAAFDDERHYVIQVDGPMTPQRRIALENLGVALSDYLPAYAYVADLGGVDAAQLAATGFVLWAGEYQDAWKIDPAVGRRGFLTPERQAVAALGNVVLDITLFEGEAIEPALASIRQAAEGPGAVVHRTEDLAGNATITATVPLASVGQLAAINAVQFVEETSEITLRNSSNRWIVQSNVLNMTPLYNAGIHGENQVVGIMDGAIDQTHCSFFDTDPVGPSHRKIHAYNDVPGASTHGTHVAGTAVGDNNINDNTRGVAYLGRLVYNSIPSFPFTEAAMYSRLQTHHNQTGRVHTNSWGDDNTTAYNGLCRGIDDFSYDFEDSLVLFAVTNLAALKNPENAKNLLAVGASQDTPNQANHCSGGAGPTSDGRRKPEIYAPGCSTSSSLAGSGCLTAGLTGTSMASPAVAGTGLLVRQYFTDGYYPSGSANPSDAFTPTAALIKATLLNSSVDMTGVTGYPSNTEGWGRVLADEALSFTGESRKLIVVDTRNVDGLTTGQVVEKTIELTSSTPKLKVTLVWTDPAASAGAVNAWINDLDLEVVNPGGTLYLGNVFIGGVSATGGFRDGKNNVEQVHLNNPALGDWTVRVRAFAVNVGTQGYALAISGAVEVDVPPVCIEDIDGNGAVDVTDLLAVIGAWGPCPDPCPPSCPADVAPEGGDCNANVSDLLAVIAAWGPCP